MKEKLILMYINKSYFLVFLLAGNILVFSQKAPCFNKKDFDFRKQSYYGIIIQNLDTFYSYHVVEGTHVPEFKKSITGQYLQYSDGFISIRSFILKGKLTGYYSFFKKEELFEEGYFYDNTRRITYRKVE